MTIVKEPKGIKIDPLFSDYLEQKETEFEWLIQPPIKSLEINLLEERPLIKEQKPLIHRSLSLREPHPPQIKWKEPSQRKQLKQLSDTVTKMAEDLYGKPSP